jgi:threonine aldolase
MWFSSDNAGPAHPAVMAALMRANEGHAASYGADEAMERVRARIREVFEAPEAAVYLVATGTAANALALACLCPPWASVFCHQYSHVAEDECGAPEFYTGGAKLMLVPGADCKMEAGALGAMVAKAAGSVHNVQRGAVSLTNATEAGTVYGPDEIAAIAAVARAHGMPVHLDGARFANALVSLGCSPAEMTWKAGVDAVSFGGTKNGLLGVEAVIMFDPARAWEFELRRKRAGHLFSKHRFLSAQMEAYLADGLWLEMARAANARAGRLARGIEEVGGRLLHPCEANEVFASWPREGHRRAHEAGARYYLWSFDDPLAQDLEGPGDAPVSARMVCNWATEEADIDRFVAIVGAEAVAERA